MIKVSVLYPNNEGSKSVFARYIDQPEETTKQPQVPQPLPQRSPEPTTASPAHKLLVWLQD